MSFHLVQVRIILREWVVSPDTPPSILAALVNFLGNWKYIFQSAQRHTRALHHIASATGPYCIYCTHLYKVVGLFFVFSFFEDWVGQLLRHYPVLYADAACPGVQSWEVNLLSRFWMKAVPCFCGEHVNGKIRASVSLSRSFKCQQHWARHQSGQQPNEATMLPCPLCYYCWEGVQCTGCMYTVCVYCISVNYVYIYIYIRIYITFI